MHLSLNYENEMFMHFYCRLVHRVIIVLTEALDISHPHVFCGTLMAYGITSYMVNYK